MPKAVATALAGAGAGSAAAVPAGRPDLRGARSAPSPCCIRTCRKRSAARSRHSPIPPSSRICKKLGVSAVELMPITAWIDERHLPPLGLQQCLGLQSGHLHGARPAPGARRPRRTARHGRRAARRPASASSSISSSTTPAKATRSGRRCRCAASTTRPITGTTAGRQAGQRHRHRQHASPAIIRSCGDLVLDTLRHFVRHAGVDGFRFDLAPVLGRAPTGFDPDAPLLQAMRAGSGACATAS